MKPKNPSEGSKGRPYPCSLAVGRTVRPLSLQPDTLSWWKEGEGVEAKCVQ
jgi:hypothetical protein